MKQTICLLFVMLLATALCANDYKVECKNSTTYKITGFSNSTDPIGSPDWIGLIDQDYSWMKISSSLVDDCANDDTVNNAIIKKDSTKLTSTQNTDFDIMKVFKCFCKSDTPRLNKCSVRLDITFGNFGIVSEKRAVCEDGKTYVSSTVTQATDGGPALSKQATKIKY